MSLPPNPHPVEVFRGSRKPLIIKETLNKSRMRYNNIIVATTGYLEKPVSLAFRGTLRGLSIGVGGYKSTAYVIVDHVPSPKPPSR